jgi:glycosyltransferase involved in cell wall biosynthesis
MNILYDHQIFEQQRIGGVSRYFSENIYHFPNVVSCEIAILYSDNIYLKNHNLPNVKPIVDYKQKLIKGLEFKGKGRLFNLLKVMNPSKYYDCYQMNREYSIELLKRQNFDIFHPTYYNDYFLEFIGKKPFVITIHDMTYEKFPEFFPIADKTSMMKKKLAQKASHIICVSENTKKDIISFLGIDEKKISVIYHGVSSIENNECSYIDIPKDYMLFIGAREGYKNFLFFIHSIAGTLIGNNINLICTGKPFSNEEIELFQNLNINNRVFHHYANDSEMAFLYKNAIAFIFPSLYEGFGIPILEAFANDCPVLLSNTSCFPEIAGEAALYFDPKSSVEIQNQISSILNSTDSRTELINKGIERLKLFSWENACNATVEVYNGIKEQTN